MLLAITAAYVVRCVWVGGWGGGCLGVSPKPRWRAFTAANIYRRSTSAPICISRERTCLLVTFAVTVGPYNWAKITGSFLMRWLINSYHIW